MKTFPFARIKAAIKADSGKGFCVECGAPSKAGTWVEPDAKKYPCHRCKAPAVYGAEQILIMGLVS